MVQCIIKRTPILAIANTPKCPDEASWKYFQVATWTCILLVYSGEHVLMHTHCTNMYLLVWKLLPGFAVLWCQKDTPNHIDNHIEFNNEKPFSLLSRKWQSVVQCMSVFETSFCTCQRTQPKKVDVIISMPLLALANHTSKYIIVSICNNTFIHFL